MSQAMEFTDVMCKQVYIVHRKQKVLVESPLLFNHDRGMCFIKLTPGRSRSITTIMTCRCSKDTKALATRRAFWGGRGQPGKAFLNKLRNLRNKSIKDKFGTLNTPRLVNRRKKKRVEQLTEEIFQVMFPAAGARPDKVINIYLPTSEYRRNGNFALWVELDSASLDHIAAMLQVDLEEDESSDNEIIADDQNDNIEEAEVGTREESTDNDQANIEEPDEPQPEMNNPEDSGKNKPRQQLNIMQAFMRGRQP